MNREEKLKALRAVIPTLDNEELKLFVDMLYLAVVDDEEQGTGDLLNAAVTEQERRMNGRTVH